MEPRVARITLQSIADELGVSRMTVSNAFSRPDQLSAELRERILAAAEALGYAGPDPAARSLARGSTGTVGVLWGGRLRHSLTDEVSARFLGAFADELAPTGLALTLLGGGSADGAVMPARDVAMDGAVVYAVDQRSDAVGWLRRRGLPLVFVDNDPLAADASVQVDDRGGAAAAAAHVLAQGHTRVGVVAAGFDLPTPVTAAGLPAEGDLKRVARERLRGWREPLDAAGAHTVFVAQENSYEDARTIATALLRLPERPTAVLCLSDLMAHDVVRAAEAIGLRVPEDLSVVGFDDHPLATRMSPALTTVRQDVLAKGKAAASALRAAIASPDEPPAPHVVLPVELIVRGSTAAPPQGRARRG